ncbi:hypothetical protein Scep_009265 [Stephania cephalantha]|uniref:Uncharacterized protein n=1 Tax=Stephania cephalantha TaxID=152367 RepID=A0AAP0PE52_9MAGN
MEPMLHNVKVLQVCNIAPPHLSVSNTTLPLTFFDLPYLIRSPSELILFYELQAIDDLYFMDTIVTKIKHSLSHTLKHFYPLSGTLSWPPESNKPIMTYTDGDSVRLTVAESNGNFNHLSSIYARNADELQPLVPQLISDSKKQVPLLAVQVTLFPHSGVSIGITTHHAVMDGRAASLFITSWASVCRLSNEAPLSSQEPSTLLSSASFPFFDRDVVKDPNGLENLYLEALIKLIRSKNMSENNCDDWLLVSKSQKVSENAITATFELTNTDFERLKRWVMACKSEELGDQQKPIQLSRFVLACAYTWVCLAKASSSISSTVHDDEELASIVFVVDCRSRTDPPIPPTYFGNCCVPIKVSAKREDIVGKNGIVVAVDCILKEMRGISVAVHNCPELRLSRTLNTGSNRVYSIAGSPQFGFYKIDFGFGKPKKIELASIARTGSILNILDVPHGSFKPPHRVTKLAGEKEKLLEEEGDQQPSGNWCMS